MRLEEFLGTLLRRRRTGEPLVFVSMGKGGVGKTTVSVMLGLAISRLGARVLVASLDPAKHLVEYLGLSGVERVEKVTDSLHAVQLDIEPRARRLGEEYAATLRRLMPALTALNLEDVLKVIRDAPGFEEEVFLRALADLYENSDYDAVVVDTPPTGVALRVLVLPRLYRFWTGSLVRLRERIVALRYTIARTLGRESKPSDPVLEKLYALRERYERLEAELRDSDRTRIVVVATPEPLPVYEARVVAEKLSGLGVRPNLYVLNRVLPRREAERLGLLGIELDAVEEIERLRCREGETTPLLVVRHASFAPHRLADIEKLLEGYVELYVECRRGPHEIVPP